MSTPKKPTPSAHSESRQGDSADHSDALSVDGNQADNSCVFCERIKKGEYDGEFANYVSFAPLNPVTAGHMLVVPKVHTANLNSSELEANQVGWALRGFTNDLEPDQDYNIITSKGADATQTIQHLHFHIIPRTKDDGLLLPWSDIATQVNEARIKGKMEMYNELWNIAEGDDFPDGIPRLLTRLGEMHDELIAELQSLQTRGSTDGG